MENSTEPLKFGQRIGAGEYDSPGLARLGDLLPQVLARYQPRNRPVAESRRTVAAGRLHRQVAVPIASTVLPESPAYV